MKNLKDNISDKIKKTNPYFILIVGVIWLGCSIVIFNILCLMNVPTVEVQALDEKKYGTVTVRGAIIDEQWYNPADIYVGGEWKYNLDKSEYTSVGNEKIYFRIPDCESFQLVFCTGPNEGVGSIYINGEYFEENWKRDVQSEHGEGISIPVETDNHQRAYKLFAALLSAICIVALYFLLIKINNAKNHLIILKLLGICSAIVLSFLVLYNFSITASPKIPIQSGFFGWDGAVFNVVGNIFARGGTPYVDAFDHKGPIIYVIYALGDIISPKWFVFLVNVCTLSISLVFAYKIGRLFMNRAGGAFSAIMALVYYMCVMDEGAITEDFNLPFLMISTYLVIKYFLECDEKPAHPHFYALFHGITVGVSLCLRVTNCIAICVFGAVIFGFLLIKKQYQNIIKNVIWFSVGFLTILVPFIIFFMSRGALYDFLFGTLLFNLRYAGRTIIHTSEEYRTIISYLAPVIVVAILAVVRRSTLRVALIFSSLAVMYYMFGIDLYPHYYIILVPFVPIAVGLVIDKESESSYIVNTNKYQMVYWLSSVCLVMWIVVILMPESIGQKQKIVENYSHIQEDTQYVQAIKQQASLIPKQDRDFVAGYDLESNWYLVNDVYSCYSVFTAHSWWPDVSDDIYERVVDEFSSLEAKWIVVKNTPVQPEVQQVLETNYELVNTTHVVSSNYDLKLYKQK